jgi:hypothetical protein
MRILRITRYLWFAISRAAPYRNARAELSHRSMGMRRADVASHSARE